MTIYRLIWKKINWGAYHTLGYNYIEKNGEIFATTEEKARELCPITPKQGEITIEKIFVNI